MNIFIKETEQLNTLTLIDPKSNVNYIDDFIGNYGALTDGQFTYDNELDAYICNQETFDWWEQVIHDNQNLDYRIQELIETHGTDAVYEVIDSAVGVDLKDHAAAMNKALDEAFDDKS